MTEETRAAGSDLLSVLAELYPMRRFDLKMIHPEILAAVVLFRREQQLLRDDTKAFRKIAPAYMDGELRLTVKPRGRKGPRE